MVTRRHGIAAERAESASQNSFLISYLSKGRGTASFEWDNNHPPSLEIVARATL